MTKTALVTGAGGGLGLATVERLAMHGWHVFAADVSEDMLRASMHDPSVVPVVMDVTEYASIEAAFVQVANSTDHLDALVNFAGVMGVGSLVDIPETRLARILDVNVMGPFRVNKRFLPLVLTAGGRIVNVSSETGWQTTAPFNGPYAMSKYAVEAYSHALRRELALLGVKVITIQPGPFRTSMVSGIESAFEVAQAETTHFTRVIERLKRLAGRQIDSAHEPDVLAQAVYKALTDRRPKPVISVKPDRLRSSLERLPLRTADRVWLTLLRRANRE